MPSSGFLLIHKPSGPTSHDIVDAVRRVTGEKTVGHAGTLDPFAEGLLIVGVGREATKRLDSFKALPKTYCATLRLGGTSDTDDRTGQVVMTNFKFQISKRDIENVLKSFVDEIDQIPPMYSAKKVGGKKLYELARKGQTIERKPAKVIIYSIQLTHYQLPTIKLTTTCSSGTYIRALARDIGEKLGCGAYLEALTRTAIGPFDLKDAIRLEQLISGNWHDHSHTFTNLESQLTNYAQPKIGNWKLGFGNSRPKVLVFGTFDYLHPGHLDFFRQARVLGTHLIVGVGRDKVVTAIKGRPARQNEEVRLHAVQACGLADEALLLPENPDERFQWIKKISPDVIALGYDQTAFTENLENELRLHDIHCRVVRLLPFQPKIYKSSKMA